MGGDLMVQAMTYEIGPMSNFGAQTSPGQAATHIVGDQQARFGNQTNVTYIPFLKGMVLAPDMALRDMALANHTCTPSGHWEVCTPPNTGADHLVNLYAQVVTSTVTSLYKLTRTPCLFLSIVRADCEGITSFSNEQQRFVFTFGGGYVLTFGGNAIPILSKSGVEVSRWPAVNFEQDGYANSSSLTIGVYNLLGKLFIVGLGGETWTVDEIGDLPAATWSISGNGGAWAVNVTQRRFATSGYFDTPSTRFYLDHTGHTLSSLSAPATQTGCTVAITDGGGTGTTRKQRVTLTGPGYTTPVVQLAQGYYAPVYDAPIDVWTDVTGWVVKKSPTITFNQDAQSDQAVITFDLEAEYQGQTLYTALGLVRGQYAFRVKMDGVPIFTGILKIRAAINGKRGELRVTAYSRLIQLKDAKLIFAPCGAGMAVADAVRMWAVHAGIRPEDVITTGLSGTLDAPTDGYDQPPWLPANGEDCLGWIDQLAQAKSFRIRTNAAGQLVAEPHYYVDNGLVFTTDAGAANSVSLSEVELTDDLSGIENVVMVEGRDKNGAPIYAWVWDEESLHTPGTSRYVGYMATRVAVNANLCTQDACNEAAISEYLHGRATGASTTRITSEHPASVLCIVRPHEVITVSDAISGMGNREFRVLNVSVQDQDIRNMTSVDAVEVWA